MKISTKGRYGLRVVLELTAQHNRGPILVENISKSQAISGKYIRVLVGGLKSAGLVRAVRGPNGGYELARNPADITVLDVVRALEGKTVPVKCVEDVNSCPRAQFCAARDMWCEVAAAIDGVLSGLTMEQLAIRQRAKQEEPVMYCI
ncbi:MAG: Rrf2 family transcriptional regulator [Candidatus Riflebacteria bacterium]|nr:Rrf2 family transcriptional regulator [Candidatus Riflebacteria bacterium]